MNDARRLKLLSLIAHFRSATRDTELLDYRTLMTNAADDLERYFLQDPAVAIPVDPTGSRSVPQDLDLRSPDSTSALLESVAVASRAGAVPEALVAELAAIGHRFREIA